MTVRLVAKASPAKRPEHILWTFAQRQAHRAGAHTDPGRKGPARAADLRVEPPTIDSADLLWSRTLEDGRDVGALADERKNAFLARGWVEADLTAVERTPDTGLKSS